MFDQYILNFLLLLTNQMPEFSGNNRIRNEKPIKCQRFAQKFKNDNFMIIEGRSEKSEGRPFLTLKMGVYSYIEIDEICLFFRQN